MTAPKSAHRAWVEVDHAALRTNLKTVRELAGAAQVIAVVKANAYGHGAVPVARTLVASGAERLAVATIEEGIELRAAGIDAPIMLLWGVGPDEAADVVANDLEPIVTDASGAELLEREAARRGRRLGVHLKVDTGLGRQGATPDAALALASVVARSPHLAIVGTMSHLAVPGEDDSHTEVQNLRLARVVDAMRSSGIDPGLVHVSASGGILAGGGAPTDAVRPGLILYGLLPAWAAGRDADLRPALTLKARPLRVFELAAGDGIGYGLRFRASKATRIATLGIGYGDGWPRVHANNGDVLVRGQRAPIVGAVSMDGITVDVGHIEGVTTDDEFVLIGEQGDDRITADEVAARRRTISYEVTTALRGRLPRLHLGAD
jgi:alanine racemase